MNARCSLASEIWRSDEFNWRYSNDLKRPAVIISLQPWPIQLSERSCNCPGTRPNGYLTCSLISSQPRLSLPHEPPFSSLLSQILDCDSDRMVIRISNVSHPVFRSTIRFGTSQHCHNNYYQISSFHLANGRRSNIRDRIICFSLRVNGVTRMSNKFRRIATDEYLDGLPAAFECQVMLK
jgi:hypothetical protein